MEQKKPDDSRVPLPNGTAIRWGTVTGLAGIGLLGPVYEVQAPATPQTANMATTLAVREFMPYGLSERVGEDVRPRAGNEAAFDEARDAFAADAQRLAALDSLSLLKAIAHWHERGTLLLALPWVSAPTVARLVGSSRALISQAELEAWMRALSEALSPMHRGRGVHGRIDPHHLRMTTSGRPLLAEPGAAHRALARLLPGDVLAASPYIAPEQLKIGSALQIGPWTDVYALAGVLYFAVSGRHPQRAAERMVADRQEPLTRLAGREYSHNFLRGIDRALSLIPTLRPASLAQLMGALGIRERRRQNRGGGSGGLLTNLPLPHVEEVDIDPTDLMAVGAMAGWAPMRPALRLL